MIDILAIIISISVSIADTISNILRIPGQFMREILLNINLEIYVFSFFFRYLLVK